MKFLPLVIANLKRHKLRTILTMCSVALALFLFASLQTVVTTIAAAREGGGHGVEENKNRPAAGSNDARLGLSTPGTHGQAIGGILYVTPSQRVSVPAERVPYPLHVIFPDEPAGSLFALHGSAPARPMAAPVRRP